MVSNVRLIDRKHGLTSEIQNANPEYKHESQ